MASGLSSLAIRTAVLVSLAGALFLAYPEPAYACKCVVPGSPSEEMAKFAMVFQGRVISVHELDRGDATQADGGELSVEFGVETVWKGNVGRSINLTTQRDTAACGIAFVEGDTYVVYAGDESDVHRCSRTGPLSEAAEDLAELGDGHSPAPGVTGSEANQTEHPAENAANGGGCGASPHPADLSVVGLMLGAVAFGLRRRRADRP